MNERGALHQERVANRYRNGSSTNGKSHKRARMHIPQLSLMRTFCAERWASCLRLGWRNGREWPVLQLLCVGMIICRERHSVRPFYLHTPFVCRQRAFWSFALMHTHKYTIASLQAIKELLRARSFALPFIIGAHDRSAKSYLARGCPNGIALVARCIIRWYFATSLCEAD